MKHQQYLADFQHLFLHILRIYNMVHERFRWDRNWLRTILETSVNHRIDDDLAYFSFNQYHQSKLSIISYKVLVISFCDIWSGLATPHALLHIQGVYSTGLKCMNRQRTVTREYVVEYCKKFMAMNKEKNCLKLKKKISQNCKQHIDRL